MEMVNTLVPKMIGQAKVLLSVNIKDNIKFTGKTKQIIHGKLLGTMHGLAICAYDGDQGFYLFGCNEKWESITDTYHDTIEEAVNQAEFEYEGTRNHWIKMTE